MRKRTPLEREMVRRRRKSATLEVNMRHLRLKDDGTRAEEVVPGEKGRE